jgi:hypothetical protein
MFSKRISIRRSDRLLARFEEAAKEEDFTGSWPCRRHRHPTTLKLMTKRRS